MPDLTDSELASLLKEEHLQLERMVEEFDSKTITIKAWSVTLSAAALVAAYVEAVPIALLIGRLSALAFWIVEAFWKTMQQAFYPRIAAIEDFMAGRVATIHPLQISRSWHDEWKAAGRGSRALGIMWWPHVLMPHLPIVAAGVLLFLLAPPAAAGAP